MKVCFFSHKSNLTGANRSLLDMIDGLKGSDIEPFVIIRKERGHKVLQEELINRGVPCKSIVYTSTLKPSSPLLLRLLCIKRFINQLAIIKIRRLIRTHHIDILHNNDMMCGLGAEAAYLEGIPYVCHLRDMIHEDHRLEFDDIEKEKSLLNHAAMVICISDYVCQKFMPWMKNQKNIVVCHNAINSNNYLIENKEIFTHDTVNISIIGRIKKTKGQFEAVKAFDILKSAKHINNINLKIIGVMQSSGRDNYIDMIRHYISERKLDGVELIPFERNVIESQRDVDIGLMCSQYEAMGRVTIESMLAGNLTIGARAGATPELIEDGVTGLLYEYGNPEDLADKIEFAMKNPQIARQIAIAGQNYALKSFDIKTYGKKMELRYKRILSHGKDNLE